MPLHAQDMDKKIEGKITSLRVTQQVNDSQKQISAQCLECLSTVGLSASRSANLGDANLTYWITRRK